LIRRGCCVSENQNAGLNVLENLDDVIWEGTGRIDLYSEDVYAILADSLLNINKALSLKTAPTC